MTHLIILTGTLAILVGLASAQLTYNENNNTWSCAQPNQSYCVGDSLSSNIIVRCDGSGNVTEGNCNDNLSGEPPIGYGTAICYQSSDVSGDAACEKNCVVYGDGSTSILPTSLCTPSYTAPPTYDESFPEPTPTTFASEAGEQVDTVTTDTQRNSTITISSTSSYSLASPTQAPEMTESPYEVPYNNLTSRTTTTAAASVASETIPFGNTTAVQTPPSYHNTTISETPTTLTTDNAVGQTVSSGTHDSVTSEAAAQTNQNNGTASRPTPPAPVVTAGSVVHQIGPAGMGIFGVALVAWLL